MLDQKLAARPPSPDAVINLARATPPATGVAVELLPETLRALAARGDLVESFRQHRFGGTEDDRAAAALWLAQRLGAPPSPDRIVVSNGTQNTLLMLLVTLVGPGATILAEELTYPQLVSLATMLDITVIPVSLDRDGLVPEAFEQACRAHSPKALYLIPTVQNPTTAVLSTERRLRIADIARRYGVALFEDDAQGLLPPGAPPPIATLAPDLTWYIMSLSKCVSLGLRIGYLVAPDAAGVARLLASFGRMSMWFAAPASAAIAAHWIRTGQAGALLDAIRQEVGRRQELAREVLGNADLAMQPCGLHMWLRPPERLSTAAMVEAAREAGVIIRAADQFAVDPARAQNGARVSIADPGLHELARGLTILSEIVSA